MDLSLLCLSKFSGRLEFLVSGRKKVVGEASREGAPKTSMGKLKVVAAICSVKAVEMRLAQAPLAWQMLGTVLLCVLAEFSL